MSFLESLEKMLPVLWCVHVCVCLHVYHIHLSSKMKENNIKFGIPLFHESKKKKKKKKKKKTPFQATQKTEKPISLISGHAQSDRYKKSKIPV